MNVLYLYPDMLNLHGDKGNILAIHSGETIITVKAQENYVQNEIKIKVYSKVENLFLDQNEICMTVNDTFKINGYVEPDDADDSKILYSSLNPQIATIDASGNITANKIGDTTIIARANENPQIKKECKLSVVRKMEDTEISIDNSLTFLMEKSQYIF